MTSAFQKFIAEHNDEIKLIAQRLSTFKSESVQLGFENARERVISWIENFDELEYKDLERVLFVLRKMDFIESSKISDKLSKFCKSYLQDVNAYIAPLGEDSESSFRITANFNQHQRYFSSFGKLIESIPDKEGNKIILFDDFLNSGGQIVTIFKSLLGIPFHSGEINDEGDKRSQLSESQKLKLRKSEIHLFYYKVFDEGTDYIDIKNKSELKLNIQIHRYTSANKFDGLFGDSDDESAIENSLYATISHGLFRGENSFEVSPFYKILKDIGLELLHVNEPSWDFSKKTKRCLGYGNDARIIVTDFNVPTNTITCLWMSGSITYKEKNIEWKALFPRRKKELKNSTQVNTDVRQNIEIKQATPKANSNYLMGLNTFTINQLERWEQISLPSLLKNWNGDDVDIAKNAAEAIYGAINNNTSLEHLGILHHTLCWLGHTPEDKHFFKKAGRPQLSFEQLGIDLAEIPEGSFVPGSSLNEKGRFDDEGPGKETKVHSFFLGKSVITNRQFALFAPDMNLYRWTDMSITESNEHPVVSVNWWQAYIYCIWAGGRLPTEIEWEYSCRAGSTTPYYSREKISYPKVNARFFEDDITLNSNRTVKATQAVTDHPFGLYHMHGNVCEWCWNTYDAKSYPNPRPGRNDYDSIGTYKVAKGGSWGIPFRASRSAFRNRFYPNYRNNDLGFRILIKKYNGK